MYIIQKIKKFFHRMSVGRQRRLGCGVPAVPNEKRYGTNAENSTFLSLKQCLPTAAVFEHVCLDTEQAKGEIDFLIIDQCKVFVIELKSWTGRIFQEDGTFYKEKESAAGKIYRKELRSPFQQINRNVYLIKQNFRNIWFEKAVLFQGADQVCLSDEACPWFTNIYDLVGYIHANGHVNRPASVENLIRNIHTYDFIFSRSYGINFRACIIQEASLSFQIGDRRIEKTDMTRIQVSHQFAYDDVMITAKNGEIMYTRLENHVIFYLDNGQRYRVSLSKIDTIRIGY